MRRRMVRGGVVMALLVATGASRLLYLADGRTYFARIGALSGGWQVAGP